MNHQVKEIIERMLKAKNCQLKAVKQAPRKFLKVPSYISKNPEYYVLHEVKQLDSAYYVIVEGDRKNNYVSVFVVIRGFVFELDEYSFEALGMADTLADYYHQIIDNYEFAF